MATLIPLFTLPSVSLFNDSGLPSSLQILSDGSFILTGDATQWNDINATNIEGVNTTIFNLFETSFEQVIPYAIIDNKIWIKVSLKANQPLVVKFTLDDTKEPEPELVFDFYDDFKTLNLNNYKFNSSLITLTAENGIGILTNKGAYKEYAVFINKVFTSTDYIFEFRQLNNPGFGVYAGPVVFFFSENAGEGLAGLDAGPDIYVWNVKMDQPTDNWRYTSYSEPSYPATMQIFYDKDTGKVIVQKSDKTYVYETDSYYNPGEDKITFGYTIRYAATVEFDYFLVRKRYNESDLSIDIQQNSDGSYEVHIVSTKDYQDIQIPIDIPVNFYKVSVLTTTPTLITLAMPPDVDSTIRFYSQFNHSAQYNGNVNFHVHTYIPPDSQTGKVKLKLTWKTFPVEIVCTDNGITKVSLTQKVTNEIVKVFDITEDMLGRHVLLNFGTIDKVYSLSQIIFASLQRLGSDEEDTFNNDLPVLYIDFHTPFDSIGSKDEFEKY